MIWNGRMKSHQMSGTREGYLKYTNFADYLSRKRLGLIVQVANTYAENIKRANLSVLEIGCGIGDIAFPLASLGYDLIGVDLDSKSIDSCNRRNVFPNASYHVADAEAVALSRSFDIVVASEIIEHCPHPELVLQTIGKHLADEGIAILTIPNGYCLYEMLFSRLFRKLGLLNAFHRLPKGVYKRLTGSPSPYHSENVFCNHVQFFTLGKFKELLKTCGLEVIVVHNLSLGLLLDWKWLSPLKRIECKLADFVPYSLAGGWVFVVSKQDNIR